MGSHIKNIHIKSFKSVRDLSLDCERINIFIGKPNAGKSNILEAISLLGVNFHMGNESKLLSSTLRYTKLVHLFNNFNFRIPIEIIVNNEIIASLKENSHNSDDRFIFNIKSNTLGSSDIGQEKPGFFIPALTVDLKSDGMRQGAATKDDTVSSSVKRYEFKGLIETNNSGLHLIPPNGDNFFAIVEAYPRIRTEIKEFLKPIGLELLINVENQQISIVQKTEDTLTCGNARFWQSKSSTGNR